MAKVASIELSDFDGSVHEFLFGAPPQKIVPNGFYQLLKNSSIVKLLPTFQRKRIISQANVFISKSRFNTTKATSRNNGVK
jgi:hypothetical protein